MNARVAIVLIAIGLAGCGSDGCDPVVYPSQSFVFDVRPSTMAAFGVTQASTPSNGGSTTFVTGPESPPLGTGSVQFTIGTDGNGAEELRFSTLDGVRLDDVTALSYWTYIQSGSGGQAPYLMLRVDWDGNGTQDDILFFEPDYQHAYTVNVPDQGDLVLGEWQFWDALVGGWWSLNDPALTPGGGVQTLATYLALHPNATVVEGTDGSGGLRLVAGFGAPAWDNFVGNADALTVGVNGVARIYNMEP